MFQNIFNQPRDLPNFFFSENCIFPSVHINGISFNYTKKRGAGGAIAWIVTPAACEDGGLAVVEY